MTLVISVAAAALAAAIPPAQHDGHAHEPRLGKLSFETSCNRPAQALFERGLGWLHSFEYAQAEQSFRRAAEADPECAIAYWGVAMSPITIRCGRRRPQPSWRRAAPRLRGPARRRRQPARARLCRRAGRLLPQFGQVDHKTRALAYTAAMAELHRRYPGDREAAVLLRPVADRARARSTTTRASRGRSRRRPILNQVLAQEPDHPGVAHYLIHSFDYPPLAGLAIPAARRYAGIAPASPHAQHMPSHIFIRLGHVGGGDRLEIAVRGSRARHVAKAQGLAGSSSERLHAMDYLAYGYLQTGQDAEAEQVLADLNAIERAEPPVFSVAYRGDRHSGAPGARAAAVERGGSAELQDNVRSARAAGESSMGRGAHAFRARGRRGAQRRCRACPRRSWPALG